MAEPLPQDDDPPRPRRTTALALVAPDAPLPPPPEGAILHPPAVPGAPRQWFLLQLWDELRPRRPDVLRRPLPGQPDVPVPVPARRRGCSSPNYFLFAVWLPFPVVSPLAERLVCVLLGGFLYKLLTRELARYRDVLDYMARYGR
jgi:hypothetical protein